MLTLTVLGNNSAVPAYGRNPTAQILQTDGESFLIDCGEGTQLQMARYKIKRSKISHVFISHLHGDHYFGLVGLLTSMGLMQRSQDLHLHGPPLLKEILDLQLKASCCELPFRLFFHGLGEDKLIAETLKFSVHSFKVKHSIECWGFLFREKRNPRSVLPHKAGSYGVPVSFFESLQKGQDYIHPKGTIVPNEELTTATPQPRSYAFCADTIFDLSLSEKIIEVDLMYHEATYLKDQEDKARLRFHSTSVQAAEVAKACGAGKLLIGHFSSKYESLDGFLNEAKEIFGNTELAIEGCTYQV